MLAVARITKLFGTEGGVLLNLYTTLPDEFDPATDPLFVMVDNLAVPLWCERFEPHGASGARVVFADLDTPKRIGEFIGRELFIEEPEREDDEFYMEDLIGFAVTAGSLHGEITDYYDSDANPLFGITFKGREETLVPAAEEFIASIDFEKRKIKLVLPDGLLEL
ncbi:MAG: 16S rRNA processing protein RimM [Rikenellaceae bacterium]|nr:16S rRNA processing protein RimM [Rikenellaceae bacterium]